MAAPFVRHRPPSRLGSPWPPARAPALARRSMPQRITHPYSSEMRKSATRHSPVETSRHQRLTLEHFSTRYNLATATRVLAGTTYPAISYIRDVFTVVDVGANIGAAALYLAATYPQATVFALEPAPEPFRLLVRNTRTCPRIVPLCYGIGTRSRRARLYHGIADSVEASVYRTARTVSHFDNVRIRDTRVFLRVNNISMVDVFKIDVEGAEVDVVRSLATHLTGSKVVYLEYHSEAGRRYCDSVMSRTHVLWRASTVMVHRGELCYVKRDLLPASILTATPELGEAAASRACRSRRH